jgi:alcohol dehydrogenase
MVLGAHVAGAAIEASMLGAAHACANPLTSQFGVTHGVAIALMLPAVVRANAAVAASAYGELMGVPEPDAAEALARRLEALRAAGGLPSRLSNVGIAIDALPALAADALEQWTLRHNPRELSEADVVALYRSVL